MAAAHTNALSKHTAAAPPFGVRGDFCVCEPLEEAEEFALLFLFLSFFRLSLLGDRGRVLLPAGGSVGASPLAAAAGLRSAGC